ncbi:hypothetical protein HRR90_006854 [Exophiala dermatitidis]|uniref:Uncharacterized protein n=1 Tax=Exophiala dermatitidis TaxID=5970 RepID=A0AAN6ERF4_EXODE|nr:hypothetical protein HRR73_007184 [Exophiala dermatitidis]KAJ4545315.1 hypothetical protein HRR77_005162 [Exophiala dermatitidis]KAJ4570874.1 hypothetical protein HRR79_003803 [Exophiala dermatitidis]KAJ4600914.1 hypothetical protein HRR84_002796 [Exophiala dermatitidis]KAJ4616389.1 hypothetical protein HRR85_003242 [Exophiala dermatitidis]
MTKSEEIGIEHRDKAIPVLSMKPLSITRDKCAYTVLPEASERRANLCNLTCPIVSQMLLSKQPTNKYDMHFTVEGEDQNSTMLVSRPKELMFHKQCFRSRGGDECLQDLVPLVV